MNESNSQWQLQLKLGFIPISMPYLILDCDQEYSTCVIGVPNRSVLYIMARTTSLESDVYQRLMNVAERAGYNRSLIKQVPQVWADEDHPDYDPVYEEVSSDNQKFFDLNEKHNVEHEYERDWNLASLCAGLRGKTPPRNHQDFSLIKVMHATSVCEPNSWTYESWGK